MLPNNTTIINPQEERAEDKIKADFLKKYKNKQNSNKNHEVTINTQMYDNDKLTNKVFSVLSDKDDTKNVRNKEFLTGQHSNNNSNIGTSIKRF